MKFGLHIINTLDDIPIGRLAQHLEERGFESLWVSEHTHIPTVVRTPYPGGGPIPEQYTRMLDPLVSLAVAATETKTLKLGTAVLLPLQRDLLVLAKEIATLDHLSAGRILVGVGVGWNREEMANHTDIPWSDRQSALVEAVEVLRKMWTENTFSYDGQFFRYQKMWSNLKPIQQGGPPILIGMSGPKGRRIAAQMSDGWIPLEFRLESAEERIVAFRRELELAGRDPSEVEITVVAGGDPTLQELHRLNDAGVSRIVLGVERDGWFDPSTALRFVDHYAVLATEF